MSIDPETIYHRLHDHLAAIYDTDRAPSILNQLKTTIDSAQVRSTGVISLSEKDVMLIAYGDHAQRDGEVPLATLREVLTETIQPFINTVHILPFYPYSSDDGFSVIDYYAVNPAFGAWDDVKALRDEFHLMFDAVVNHISAHSDWFQGFLRGESPYTDYFITVPPDTDLSAVVRPRALPLLTPFETPDGTKHVWTTFSADQIDLNYASPELLLEVVKVMLFYVEQGARFIRLDAIAFIWKEIGTTSIHLPQAHRIIQLLHDVLQIVAPEVVIITETNVPREENISYFGDGTNEAQMVYQFPLPPLLLHTLRTGDTSRLTAWAKTIQRVSDETTFFNFTASHDGIGMRPTTGLLDQSEIDALVQLAQDHGGRVSFKNNPDGSQSPYELNISYFDAITDPQITATDPGAAARRFIVSQAMMLAFIGVPGIYFHSLFGSRNWNAGVEQTGHNRTINREKLDAGELLRDLHDPSSIRAKTFNAYRHLLQIRRHEPAFHPLGSQTVLDLGTGVFALERTSPDEKHHVLALHNVTDEVVSVTLPETHDWHDLIAPQSYRQAEITLEPYQIAWLKRARI